MRGRLPLNQTMHKAKQPHTKKALSRCEDLKIDDSELQ